jgi:hypothetical protein
LEPVTSNLSLPLQPPKEFKQMHNTQLKMCNTVSEITSNLSVRFPYKERT